MHPQTVGTRRSNCALMCVPSFRSECRKTRRFPEPPGSLRALFDTSEQRAASPRICDARRDLCLKLLEFTGRVATLAAAGNLVGVFFGPDSSDSSCSSSVVECVDLADLCVRVAALVRGPIPNMTFLLPASLRCVSTPHVLLSTRMSVWRLETPKQIHT